MPEAVSGQSMLFPLDRCCLIASEAMWRVLDHCEGRLDGDTGSGRQFCVDCSSVSTTVSSREESGFDVAGCEPRPWNADPEQEAEPVAALGCPLCRVRKMKSCVVQRPLGSGDAR